MYDIQPKDAVAVIIIFAFVILEVAGLDGQLFPLVALIVGYYFGHRESGVDSGV